MLDPLYVTDRRAAEDDIDLVTVITVHSAKGTERDVCYVLNVSPQAYPLSYVIGDPEKVEEERRVLYVALTRPKNELIITRHCPSRNGGYTLWAHEDHSPEKGRPETYFLNSIPESLVLQTVHQNSSSASLVDSNAPETTKTFSIGIRID